MDSVESCATVVSLVNRVLLNVGLGHCSNHVEMDRVAAQLEGLADVKELTVLNPTDHGLITRGVQHDVCSVLVNGSGLRVAPVDDISGEETNFSSHLNRFTAECLLSSIVLPLKWAVQGQD